MRDDEDAEEWGAIILPPALTELVDGIVDNLPGGR